jgi:hypothetical protein
MPRARIPPSPKSSLAACKHKAETPIPTHSPRSTSCCGSSRGDPSAWGADPIRSRKPHPPASNPKSGSWRSRRTCTWLVPADLI